MFGLPIFRRRTLSGPEKPKTCPTLYSCDPSDPPKLKSALRLAEMVKNHYSLIISADWTNIASWGSTPSGPPIYTSILGRTGTGTTSNSPHTSTINWKDAKPRYIVKTYSYGYDNFTIFRTQDNQLYGTGNNGNFVLNRHSGTVENNADATNAFQFMVDDVIDFCASGFRYLLYVKSNGRVYGLGPKNDAFGCSQANQKALTKDDGTESNYLGVDNAIKVFTTSPDDSNEKSFVLKNDGTVMACGYNTDGCLGVNSSSAKVFEWQTVKVKNLNGTFSDLTNVIDIIPSNFVLAAGANSSSAELWSGGAGSGHMTTYFLTSDGSVYTCGSNKFGQLGINESSTTLTRQYAVKTSITKASQMCGAAGGSSIMVTTTEDKVYTWGNNQFGQLGLNHKTNTIQPTQATFPAKKISMIHGGGINGIVNGAFLIVCTDGTIYGAGFNNTYALGLTDNAGNADAGPILTFRRNNYFGLNSISRQDPQRYPLSITGDTTKDSTIISNTVDGVDKNVYGKTEKVYVRSGMLVSGTGIPADTYVQSVDINKKIIRLTNPATATGTVNITYDEVLLAFQADLCGYGTEMAQKIVSEDGTLYMSGWNQDVNGYHNFNPYYTSENILIPTYFDAKFS